MGGMPSEEWEAENDMMGVGEDMDDIVDDIGVANVLRRLSRGCRCDL